MKKQKVVCKLDSDIYECFCCDRFCTDKYVIRGNHKSGGRGKIKDRFICKRCYKLLNGIEKGELITIKKESTKVAQSL